MRKFALFAIGLAALPASALAQETLVVRASEAVSHADLNLGTREGVAALNRRINTAIRRVCRTADSNNWMETAQSSACRSLAWSDVAAQRDAAVLAYRNGQTGTRIAVVAR